MTRITSVSLRRVLDSRGNPTVEADVLTESGGFGRGAAPSGASTGEYEAIELPASESIAKAREHAVPRLEGVYAGDQRAVDNALRAADGTDDFSAIGANSAVAISMAAAKAAADVLGAPLYQHLGGAFRGENFPIPLGNVVGGGEHAKEATHIQEFLAAPVGAPSVSEAVFANAAVHAAVADVLDERGVPAAKGDEGAWAPPISDADAFEVVD
ncbi:enolase, partial [Halorubrum sp. C3]